eukprot:gb/GFBE01043436.1/.p1 GENE.gb/GFBE01043436.1/~~gb/GFBE01043436.1/.p1  ORF type:complete len:103 (+),score=20.17 gb/GFBE01043436.1/:1-309(+)
MDRSEFWKFVHNPALMHYLSVLDVEVHDVESLFDILDDGDGHITIDEFCKGIGRIKGEARAIDMVSLMHDTYVVQQACRKISRDLASLEQRIGGGARPNVLS